MTIWIDDMFKYPMGEFKRRSGGVMKMSHMIGDNEEELHAMAQAIGVARKWYQGDHYDVAMVAREKAIALGAISITLKQLAAMAFMRRCGKPMGDPATAVERMLEDKGYKPKPKQTELQL